MIYSLQDAVTSQLATIVRDNAAQAGVTIKLKGLDRNTYLAAADAGQYDIYAGNFAIMDDPATNMTLTYLPGGAINYSRVNDPQLTRIITSAQAGMPPGGGATARAQTWRNFRRDPLGMASAGILFLLVMVAVFAPLLVPVAARRLVRAVARLRGRRPVRRGRAHILPRRSNGPAAPQLRGRVRGAADRRRGAAARRAAPTSTRPAWTSSAPPGSANTSGTGRATASAWGCTSRRGWRTATTPCSRAG